MIGTRRLYTKIEACRSCGSAGLEQIVDLGTTPLADRLLVSADLGETEPSCPLTVVFCAHCGLLQIAETVAPEILFGVQYPYYSSVSPALLAHFKASADEIRGRRNLGADSLVVELASNDGYQLKNYVAHGIPVLGIDPAPGPARRAIELGIPTRITFFTRDYAEELRGEGVAADVVHANNVVAHVEDTNGFVAGIALLLKDDGEAVVEFPYLLDLVERCEFDTIYHQHLCYFSVTSATALFERHGLFVNRVERTSIHGGSLRLFLGKVREPDGSVAELLRLERDSGLDRPAVFHAFGARIPQLRDALRSVLDEIRAADKRVAGYGAAAKACTLMSYCGIDRDDIEYIVDRNEFKQGRLMPGNHIAIEPVERLLEDMPDYVLILPWNFADEIIAQQAEYRARGGRFIVPVPEPRII